MKDPKVQQQDQGSAGSAQNSPPAKQYDLIVVGSGAAAMASAVVAASRGLKVVVLEKHHQLGGTSAWSGGWLWVPRNPLAKDAGINEEIDAPMTYLRSEMGDLADDPRVRAFLENGPEMVEFFRKNTELSFIDGNKIPDFHQQEGACLGGRSVAAAAFDGRKLGDWLYKMRPPLSVISLWGMGIASGQDIGHFFNATRSVKSALYVTRRVGRHLVDLVRFRRGTQLVNGNALIGSLLRSALDLGVEFRTSVPVSGLVRNSRGEVLGVSFTNLQGASESIYANAVILGCGGFPHDKKRQQEQFPASAGRHHYSAAPEENTGDGLNMAEACGAKISDDYRYAGAWSPVSRVPDGNGGYTHFPHLIERAKPGVIAVRPNGKRFVSEADSYHDFMSALYSVNEAGKEPECWLIADHKTQRRWGLGWSRPFPFPLGGYINKGYLKRGNTLRELAQQCGIDADGLEQTVERFNHYAKTGKDEEFQRGESAYNRVQGDPTNQPNPSLGPVKHGPFYAVKIVAGSLGTFSGITTNEYAQVQDNAGQVIPGLYAVGNDMASIFRGNYPSGGITLGPGMTFGYIAAHVIADQISGVSEQTDHAA